MKRENNAIKRIIKVTTSTDLQGYFLNDNNIIVSNGYSIVKFSNDNIDYIDGLNELKNKYCLTLDNLIKDHIERHGDAITVSISVNDLKMWKKYGEKDQPFVAKFKNKYIGVNPNYLLDLAILTRQDKNENVNIKVLTEKAPIYIDGNGVQALLCPVYVGYFDDNKYNSFLESVKACYIQDAKTKEENEKQKALKNTDKIEKDVIYNGFTMWIGGKQYFLMSNKKRVTDEITKDFLKLIAANTTINIDKISESDFKYIKNAINSATITKTTSYYGNEEIYRIETKYNSENFYKNEYDRLIIYNGNMEKIGICADDTSATDEETPKTATIQDNAADIVANPDATATKTADNMSVTDTGKVETPTHKSSNCLFVTVAKDLKPEKVAQLQNVANLPTLASVPTYSAYLAQKINNIVNTKRNTNNGKKAHKRTNGATLAECAGVLKIANTS